VRVSKAADRSADEGSGVPTAPLWSRQHALLLLTVAHDCQVGGSADAPTFDAWPASAKAGSHTLALVHRLHWLAGALCHDRATIIMCWVVMLPNMRRLCY
jgi:hypothetical protein